MSERPEAPRLDTRHAHSARVYNYWLGGKDNFAADRMAGLGCPMCATVGHGGELSPQVGPFVRRGAERHVVSLIRARIQIASTPSRQVIFLPASRLRAR
jgi:hypothetical protein